jgi:AcrR family transcriptional regulator
MATRISSLAAPKLRNRTSRKFKQRRAADTYRALLSAAADVFARRGFDGAQTPEIAQVAGVSTGAFYRYFQDKRQAFIEMLADHLDETQREVLGQLEPQRFVGTDQRASIDLVIDVLFDRARRLVELDRVFLGMSFSDPQVERMRAEFEAVGLRVIGQLISVLIPREVVPHPHAAAIVIQVAALEVAGDRAGLRPRSGPEVPDAQVKTALREMIYRYLYPDGPTGLPAPSRSSKRATRVRSGDKTIRDPLSSRRTG